VGWVSLEAGGLSKACWVVWLGPRQSMGNGMIRGGETDMLR
jgi:hypothetical protein